MSKSVIFLSKLLIFGQKTSDLLGNEMSEFPALVIWLLFKSLENHIGELFREQNQEMAARFLTPVIQDNPIGWGPNTIPPQFKGTVPHLADSYFSNQFPLCRLYVKIGHSD